LTGCLLSAPAAAAAPAATTRATNAEADADADAGAADAGAGSGAGVDADADWSPAPVPPSASVYAATVAGRDIGAGSGTGSGSGIERDRVVWAGGARGRHLGYSSVITFRLARMSLSPMTKVALMVMGLGSAADTAVGALEFGFAYYAPVPPPPASATAAGTGAADGTGAPEEFTPVCARSLRPLPTIHEAAQAHCRALRPLAFGTATRTGTVDADAADAAEYSVYHSALSAAPGTLPVPLPVPAVELFFTTASPISKWVQKFMAGNTSYYLARWHCLMRLVYRLMLALAHSARGKERA